MLSPPSEATTAPARAKRGFIAAFSHLKLHKSEPLQTEFGINSLGFTLLQIYVENSKPKTSQHNPNRDFARILPKI